MPRVEPGRAQWLNMNNVEVRDGMLGAGFVSAPTSQVGIVCLQSCQVYCDRRVGPTLPAVDVDPIFKRA
jgi:hypothetical protein